MARALRLSVRTPLPKVVDAWLFQLGVTKPAEWTLKAYRRDVAGRIDT